MPASEEYHFARDLLKSRFGPEMQVVNAHLEALGNGAPLHFGNIDAMYKLYRTR